MYQRTRVMQRNVRMILILVDGQSTVADLCLKTGNRQLTESALDDLEKGGFVELRVEQDSIWAESKKVAQEIRAAAIDKALQFSRNNREKDTPASAPAPVTEPPISIHSVFNSGTRHSGPGTMDSQFSLAPGMRKQLSSKETVSPDFSQPKIESGRTGRQRSQEPPTLSLVERFKAWFARPERDSAKPEVTQKKTETKPVRLPRRRTGRSLSWPVVLFYGLVALGVAIFLAINFFPFDRYVPQVEALASRISGQAVKLGSMRVEVYPKPGLFLNDVRTGQGRDEIRISEVRLLPDVWSLNEPKKIIQDAVFSGVSVSPALVSGLGGVFSAMAKPDAGIAIKRLRFEKVQLAFAGLSLRDLEGEAGLSTDSGQYQSLRLWSSDRTVTLELKPVADNQIRVAFEGLAWHPVEGSSVVIDSFALKGDVQQGRFSINDFELHAFDGVIKGQAVAVEQAETIFSLSGNMTFERINATRLGESLGIGPQFSGETSGSLTFSTVKEPGSSIFATLNANGDFMMRNGGVREMDLVETVRRASSVPVLGGATSFEKLSGNIKLTPSNSVFSGLVLSSGLMQSAGSIEVDRELNIRGRMELQMRGSVNQTRVPIAIKGTLKVPELRLAGAR